MREGGDNETGGEGAKNHFIIDTDATMTSEKCDLKLTDAAKYFVF